MSASVFVVDSAARRTQIKVTPGKVLREVLEEACRAKKLNPEAYALKTSNNKAVDLSQPFRLSGLSAGAKLQLVQASRSTGVVSVALQLPDVEGGGRFTDKFPSNTSLWLVLRKFEEGVAGQPQRKLNLTQRALPSDGSGAGRLLYEQPSINVMSRTIETFTDLQKTLAQLGINGGSMLMRLNFKNSGQPLEEAMAEISGYFTSVDATSEESGASATQQARGAHADGVGSMSSVSSTEGTTQVGSTGLPEPDMAVGDSFEATEGPRHSDTLTVSESGPASEEESASVLEHDSQLQDVHPFIAEEVYDALPASTQAVPEVEPEEILDVSAVDIQESSDIPLEADAAFDGEADHDEEVHDEFLEASTVDSQETSENLSGGAELVFEGETSPDEVLDEAPEFPVDDVVAATADSSLSSEDTGLDVSTPDQLEQEEDSTELHHDDGIESTSQADPALDEVDELVTPALSQSESMDKSLPFSMLQAALPQCSMHMGDHEVMGMVSTMIDDE